MTWISSYVRVDDTGFVLKLNSLDLNKNGGDFDGDTVAVFALLTDEAIQQAKDTMNPRHTKTCWYAAKTTSKIVYDINHDASTAIYAATKK